jgi:MFS family permease
VKLNWKAIFFGFITYLIGLLITGMLRAAFAMINIALEGRPIETMQPDTASLTHLFVTFINRVLSALLAGWVAAKVARCSALKHATLAGIVVTVFSVALAFIQMRSPLWFNTICWLVTIPAAMIGGRICEVQCIRLAEQAELSNSQPPIPEP